MSIGRFLIKAILAAILFCSVALYFRHRSARRVQRATEQAVQKGFGPAPEASSSSLPPVPAVLSLPDTAEAMTEVLWLEQRTVRKSHEVPIPIDPSVSRVVFAAFGEIRKCGVEVIAPRGTQADSVPAIHSAEVSKGSWMAVDRPTVGRWLLRVETDDSVYITARAVSTMALESVRWVERDSHAPGAWVPGDTPLQPDAEAVAQIDFSGAPQDLHVALIEEDGTELLDLGPPIESRTRRPVPGHREARELLFRMALPRVPFRFLVRGHDAQGNAFERMAPTLYSPEPARGQESLRYRNPHPLSSDDCQRLQRLAPLFILDQGPGPARAAFFCVPQGMPGAESAYAQLQIFHPTSSDRLKTKTLEFRSLPFHRYSDRECGELTRWWAPMPRHSREEFLDAQWSADCRDGEVRLHVALTPRVR